MVDWRIEKYCECQALGRMRDRLDRLYGPELGAKSFNRLVMLIGRYGVGEDAAPSGEKWSEKDALLISYGDMIQNGDYPLASLRCFMEDWLKDAFSMVHVLPFFPYSSDDGFSVIDYREVYPPLGKWRHIEELAGQFRLMVDLVLNHVSRSSEWFKDYVSYIAPGRHYFIEGDLSWDLSKVVRPRSSPLLTDVDTRGGKKHVWTTFSDDQIDLDFRNPWVLFEFLDILLLYIKSGAKIIRLDAIAYLWKEVGTSCIHLPQTHEVVKFLRDFFAIVSPDVLIITETNVPHEENISYFGEGDEADIVYQFTLPPLLMHGLQSGDATYLTNWAAELADPPVGCTFLNFTASHDGIGVRPLEGILPDRAIETLLQGIKMRGGKVSVKQNADGSNSPYELNITYVDALSDPVNEDEELHIARFLCSQAVPLALKGIPAVYFNSLVATRNDSRGVQRTGKPRAINRYRWQERELDKVLADNDSMGSKVFNSYLRMLRVRRGHKAFHPDGGQQVLKLGREVFGLVRRAPDRSETILALHNFRSSKVELALKPSDITRLPSKLGQDVLGKSEYDLSKPIVLEPYQVVWLRWGK
ncbi:MAG: sugar phosphorylase [Sedimentisphaerales bacterium]|nr:sugar phosphorylase [Sedimentisphaerales bacterium]